MKRLQELPGWRLARHESQVDVGTHQGVAQESPIGHGQEPWEARQEGVSLVISDEAVLTVDEVRIPVIVITQSTAS